MIHTEPAIEAAAGSKPAIAVFAPLESGQGVGAGGGIKTVLIVDDSVVERENLKGILLSAGIQVLEADNGESGVEMAKTHQPDLIFLDIMMPGMDGFAACRALHGDEKTLGIPVVMLSSKANRSDKVWAEQMGANDYLTKPYTAEQILEKIS
ncbi:response regulator [Thiolapillus sp.]